MNIILLTEEDFVSSGRARLTGRRAEHIRTVLRAREEDELAVGLLDGLMGMGTLLAVDHTSIEMEVRLAEPPPAPLPVTLILALPRPKVFRRVLQTAASMGVKKIYLINAFRVEKSFWKSPFLNEPCIREQLILGLEQAKDTIMPKVEQHPLFKPFVEDELPTLSADTLRLVAHPTGEHRCPRRVDQTITLVIGPEGGFVQYELDKLKDFGFAPVTLGRRILRVEAAVPALLSQFLW